MREIEDTVSFYVMIRILFAVGIISTCQLTSCIVDYTTRTAS